MLKMIEYRGVIGLFLVLLSSFFTLLVTAHRVPLQKGLENGQRLAVIPRSPPPRPVSLLSSPQMRIIGEVDDFTRENQVIDPTLDDALLKEMSGASMGKEKAKKYIKEAVLVAITISYRLCQWGTLEYTPFLGEAVRKMDKWFNGSLENMLRSGCGGCLSLLVLFVIDLASEDTTAFDILGLLTLFHFYFTCVMRGCHRITGKFPGPILFWVLRLCLRRMYSALGSL